MRPEAFLREHNPTRIIPVPIEEIAEFKLEIAFDIKAALKEACEVDAFINADCSVIYIDAGVWLSPNTNRLRFSIAHEVAHSVLHRAVLAKLKFDSMPQWREVYQSIPEDEYGWLEFQANSLAGLILVPAPELANAAKDFAAKNGLELASMDDAKRYVMETALAKHFGVSHEVIERRVSKDNLVNG